MQITNTTDPNAKCCCCDTSNSFADLKELHFDGADNRFGICVTLCKRCRDKLVEDIAKVDAREEDPIDSAETMKRCAIKPRDFLQGIPTVDEMTQMPLECVPVGHLYRWALFSSIRKQIDTFTKSSSVILRQHMIKNLTQ